MTSEIKTRMNILMSTTSDVLEYKVNVNVNSSIYRLLKITPCYAQGNCISIMEFTPGLLESVRHANANFEGVVCPQYKVG